MEKKKHLKENFHSIVSFMYIKNISIQNTTGFTKTPNK